MSHHWFWYWYGNEPLHYPYVMVDFFSYFSAGLFPGWYIPWDTSHLATCADCCRMVCWSESPTKENLTKTSRYEKWWVSSGAHSEISGHSNCNSYLMGIVYIIAKNIYYLRRNRGAWHSFHNTHQTFLAPCIRCINHLCDSYRLVDVNPHFTTPGCWYGFKLNSCWPIVTS